MITDFDDLCLWTYVIVDDILIELAPLLRPPVPLPLVAIMKMLLCFAFHKPCKCL